MNDLSDDEMGIQGGEFFADWSTGSDSCHSVTANEWSTWSDSCR